MSLEIMQMWGLVAGGSQNGLAALDIPANGVLWGIDWAMSALFNADAEELYAEVSFVATAQATSNDVRGIISAIRQQIHLLTSGVSAMGVNKYVALPTGLNVAGGERLFLNVFSTTGLAGDVNVYVQYEPSARGPARRSSRRR